MIFPDRPPAIDLHAEARLLLELVGPLHGRKLEYLADLARAWDAQVAIGNDCTDELAATAQAWREIAEAARVDYSLIRYLRACVDVHQALCEQDFAAALVASVGDPSSREEV